MGLGYYQGNHMVNDEQLLQDDVNRYYDVYGKETDYRKMEDVSYRLRYDLQSKTTIILQQNSSTYSANILGKKKIPAISAVAAANGVPIFSPAMVDSAYGETFLLAKNQGHNVHID